MLQVTSVNAVENTQPISDQSLNVLLNTFSDFNVSDFIKFVATHSQNRVAAEIVFKHKFIGEKYEIDGSLFKNGSIEETLNVLEFFGHLITKLKIDYEYINTNQSAKLNRCLNECCAHLLHDIELSHCDDEKLIRLHGPFTKVESITLQFGNLRNDSMEFEKIFPAVRKLDLSEMFYTLPGCFERPFLHLESLKMEFWNGLYPQTLPVLEKRLQLNPQLKHITFGHSNWNILRMLSKYVPMVQSVELNHFHDKSTFEGEDIQFDHMKVFKINIKCEIHAEKIPIVFGNLEEIECYEPLEKWIHIIENNKNLKKMHVDQLNDKQLIKISEELTHLEEITTHFKALPVASVVRFLQQNKELRAALFNGIDNETRNKILKRAKAWKIANGSIFVRE